MSKRGLALVIAANYTPVVAAAVLYEGGAPLMWMLLLPLHILLLALNNRVSGSRNTLLLFSANLLVSTVAAHRLWWYLYARFVCNDIAGAALALGGLIIGTALVLISSLIMLILKKKPSSSYDADTSKD